MAVFAINSHSSWERLSRLRNRVVREHEDKEEVPFVIAGNKKVLNVLSRQQHLHDQVCSFINF